MVLQTSTNRLRLSVIPGVGRGLFPCGRRAAKSSKPEIQIAIWIVTAGESHVPSKDWRCFSGKNDLEIQGVSRLTDKLQLRFGATAFPADNADREIIFLIFETATPRNMQVVPRWPGETGSPCVDEWDGFQ